MDLRRKKIEVVKIFLGGIGRTPKGSKCAWRTVATNESNRTRAIPGGDYQVTRLRWAIIDDNPITLDKAARAGIIRAGLLNPWNAHSAHPLFNNLLEVMRYIESLAGRPRP